MSHTESPTPGAGVGLQQSPWIIPMPMTLCPAESQNQVYGTSSTAGVQLPREGTAPTRCLAAPPVRGGVEGQEAHKGLQGVGWEGGDQRAATDPGLPSARDCKHTHLGGLPEDHVGSRLGDMMPVAMTNGSGIHGKRYIPGALPILFLQLQF